MRSLRLISLITFCALSLGACSIYRVAVQQGNVITSQQLAELHPGMDEMQVRTILGSPLLKDPWYPHQWVYAYSYKPAYSGTEVRKVVVLFDKDDNLIGVQGDVKATAKSLEKKSD
ncbi:outer membrane protein assembly factor BamE [Acidithiobacillus marinus]|uniref:Outer membrane protein assembly factor BamE n=1 Tax=Acidithiobacillus marinus TaxID=187490 RepID=A0A2I1DQ44_9PROT|nr:outer membrane protein assembly factor BamE [Acidithiobacillus marinus]PKY11986.1 outer membrane protein assembly factor BamE [Acidithiobacillus marinus]